MCTLYNINTALDAGSRAGITMILEQSTSFYSACHKYIENIAKKRLQGLICNVLFLGEDRELAVHSTHTDRAQRQEQRLRVHS